MVFLNHFMRSFPGINFIGLKYAIYVLLKKKTSRSGKKNPCHLSFVYASHISLRVRTALNFGQQSLLLELYLLECDTCMYTTIYDVKFTVL